MYIQKKVLLLQAVINHTVAFATIGPLKFNKKTTINYLWKKD